MSCVRVGCLAWLIWPTLPHNTKSVKRWSTRWSTKNPAGPVAKRFYSNILHGNTKPHWVSIDLEIPRSVCTLLFSGSWLDWVVRFAGTYPTTPGRVPQDVALVTWNRPRTALFSFPHDQYVYDNSKPRTGWSRFIRTRLKDHPHQRRIGFVPNYQTNLVWIHPQNHFSGSWMNWWTNWKTAFCIWVFTENKPIKIVLRQSLLV